MSNEYKEILSDVENNICTEKGAYFVLIHCTIRAKDHCEIQERINEATHALAGGKSGHFNVHVVAEDEDYFKTEKARAERSEENKRKYAESKQASLRRKEWLQTPFAETEIKRRTNDYIAKIKSPEKRRLAKEIVANNYLLPTGTWQLRTSTIHAIGTESQSRRYLACRHAAHFLRLLLPEFSE